MDLMTIFPGVRRRILFFEETPCLGRKKEKSLLAGKKKGAAELRPKEAISLQRKKKKKPRRGKSYVC